MTHGCSDRVSHRTREYDPAMDTWKYYGITHGDHIVCNPTSTERLDECIELLELTPGASVWEGGCGKGEFLIRLAERCGVYGVGVDISPHEVSAARDRAAARVPDADLRFIEAITSRRDLHSVKASLATSRRTSTSLASTTSSGSVSSPVPLRMYGPRSA